MTIKYAILLVVLPLNIQPNLHPTINIANLIFTNLNPTNLIKAKYQTSYLFGTDQI